MKIALLANDAREILREYHLPAPYFGTAPAALLQGFARLPELEVHVVSCWQKPMAAPEKLAPNIWFHGLLVPKLGWLRTGYQGCIRAVRHRLKGLAPQIVHGQGTERDCAISSVFSGFPNVLTIHGNMRLIAKVNAARPFTYAWLMARLESFTLPRTDGVVCITRYTQDAVASLARRTWIVPNAVDESFFNLARAVTTRKTILCVGHVTLRKNQIRFIEALDNMATPGEFEVLFLGAAPDSDDYARRFLTMVKSRPWCQYGGLASRQQLRESLSHATALVLPSLEDNCPMVVLEAMAAGVPVAACNVGGVPELVEHGRTGLLFDPTVPSDIVATIKRLLRERDAVERMALEAKHQATFRFHPQEIAKRHCAIYEEVLNARS